MNLADLPPRIREAYHTWCGDDLDSGERHFPKDRFIMVCGDYLLLSPDPGDIDYIAMDCGGTRRDYEYDGVEWHQPIPDADVQAAFTAAIQLIS